MCVRFLHCIHVRLRNDYMGASRVAAMTRHFEAKKLISRQRKSDYSLIAFNERVTFCFNVPGHCLVCVRLLHCMCARVCNGNTQAYMQIMQHNANAQGSDRTL